MTYGIPEALAYLRERSEWLKREIQGGGNFEHLNTRRDECLYIAKCIEDTSNRVNAAASDTSPQGKSGGE